VTGWPAMRLKIIRSGPTHEDALQAKITALQMGLTEISFYGESESDRAIAREALEEASAAYKRGVYAAVD
jgi:hypothetical protein